MRKTREILIILMMVSIIILSTFVIIFNNNKTKQLGKVTQEKNIYAIEQELENNTIKTKTLYANATSTSLPSSYDLRDYITIEVKNQGPFGICYACAGTTAMETNYAKLKGKQINFSEIHAACLSSGGKYRTGL